MGECCMYESVLERIRRGDSVRFAIPIYDTKTREWIYDAQRFTLRADCNFDRALEKLSDSV